MSPKISIILPIYNGAAHLADTVRCLHGQTFLDFEVICVDDGSSDNSCAIVQEIADADARFVLLRQSHSGAGAARNLGLSAARGEYVLFSDSDDQCQPDGLEKLYRQAEAVGADIVACNYAGLDGKGKPHLQTGVQTAFLPKGCSVFSWRDCPGNILRVTGSMVWNKLYRREFLLENGLKFDELLTCNDLSFAAMSLAWAEKVSFLKDHLIHYRFPRLSNPKNISDVVAAVESLFRQADTLPNLAEIQKAVLRFGVDHYIGALKKFVKDFSDPEAVALYTKAHDLFSQGAYLEFSLPDLGNGELYREFATVQKHDYETMKLLLSRRIIVSMTSYPKRIGTVVKALESLYAQTRKPDEVVLWLAEEQFPGKEADLPENLMTMVREKGLRIGWCEDMKGHKKYFYALQEYCNDIVVTSDDDLLYPADMLESLHKSYLLYPNAISTMRTHLMLLSEDGQILPYHSWIRETDGTMHQPSMQLMASGGAGDLYPPGLYRKEFFDRDVVMNRCLWADNLWVKIMELVSDVPVVLAHEIEPLRYVEDTQEETLFQINGELNQYDTQLQDVTAWLDEVFYPNILQEKLRDPEKGLLFQTPGDISYHVNVERKKTKLKLRQLEVKLKESEKRNQQTLEEVKETRSSQAAAEKSLSLARTDLKKAQTALVQVQQSKPLGRQLRALGDQLRRQRAEGFTPGLMLRFMLYYLAWIPEKMLAAMMFMIENGMSRTLKKLLRRE